MDGFKGLNACVSLHIINYHSFIQMWMNMLLSPEIQRWVRLGLLGGCV